MDALVKMARVYENWPSKYSTMMVIDWKHNAVDLRDIPKVSKNISKAN